MLQYFPKEESGHIHVLEQWLPVEFQLLLNTYSIVIDDLARCVSYRGIPVANWR